MTLCSPTTKALSLVALSIFPLLSVAQSLPEQAQASTLAVPDPTPSYASALVLTQCRKVLGLVLVDHDGTLHPQQIGDLKAADVQRLLDGVPADKIIQASVPCPNEVSL